MKSFAYTLTATALVSLAPYLTLFNPECFPNAHGLFIFSILFILMLFTNIKEKVKSYKKKIIAVYVLTYTAVALISITDLHSITQLLKMDMGAYILLPLITPALALLLIKSLKPLSLSAINLALFSTLFVHLVTMNTDIGIPILSFTLLKLI